MKNSERWTVYAVGFVFGLLIVSFMIMRRAAKSSQAEDPWYAHHQQVSASGVEALPASVEVAMLAGELLRFGYLPGADAPLERVWLLQFRKSYPYVRVVETIETGEIHYMAADQIKVKLAPGVDVTDLKPVLEELGVRLRMFNRKENVAVLGVLHTGIDAVPETLQAMTAWQHLYSISEPDWIQFR